MQLVAHRGICYVSTFFLVFIELTRHVQLITQNHIWRRLTSSLYETSRCDNPDTRDRFNSCTTEDVVVLCLARKKFHKAIKTLQVNRIRKISSKTFQSLYCGFFYPAVTVVCSTFMISTPETQCRPDLTSGFVEMDIVCDNSINPVFADPRLNTLRVKTSAVPQTS